MKHQKLVKLDPTMPVSEMNYTQVVMERYRLRYRVNPLTYDMAKVKQRVREVDARLLVVMPL